MALPITICTGYFDGHGKWATIKGDALKEANRMANNEMAALDLNPTPFAGPLTAEDGSVYMFSVEEPYNRAWKASLTGWDEITAKQALLELGATFTVHQPGNLVWAVLPYGDSVHIQCLGSES
jgi:hypothetical protein